MRGAGVAQIAAPGDWLRLAAGLLVIYAPCAYLAEALGSTRGEWGLLVAALALAMSVLVARLLFRETGARVWASLERPSLLGLIAALAIGAALILVIPVFAAVTGAQIAIRRDAAWLALGIFAQAGVFEESLFRAYLFGRVRDGRGFWRAALLAAIPFVAVHLWLFASMDATIAILSIALAFVTSFPLARLYELGGGAIWAPALVHAVIQGGLKLIAVGAADLAALSLAWFAACFTLPWLVFAFPQNKTGGVSAAGSV